MKLFISTLFLHACISTVSSLPLTLSRRGVDPNLVPQFGHSAGLNPTGSGDCDGIPNAQGVPIKVPCGCPPDRDSFIASLSANVAAGHVISNPSVKISSFPADDSKDSQLARISVAAVTLQNLHGPGVGCPIVSTTFSAQSQAIQNESASSSLPLVSSSTTTPLTTAPPASESTASVTNDVDCPPDVTIVITKTVTADPTTSATPAPPSSASPGEVDPNLVPEFGLAAGLNPTGTGDCDGIPNAQGVPIKIPCICPPDRASFIQSLSANVAAGQVINNPSVKISSFPTDNSKDSQLARLNVASVTLQNLRGPGVGCPIVSTTFSAQAKAIQNGGTPSASSSTSITISNIVTSASTSTAPIRIVTQSAATTSASTAPISISTTAGIDPNLVPEFGLASGLNPTGTGDCDGIPNAQGVPIKIPCICPPDRTSFIQSLSANVAAGHAVNNTGAKITFPTDDSKDSQLARIHAASITLQNLRGPGVGCPIVSTTFSAQADAIQNGDATPSPVSESASSTTSQAPSATQTVTSTSVPKPASTASVDSVDPSLVPQFGHAAGLNPTGSGDCDGIPNAQGVPIKIPCTCPPDRASFIQSLSANVAAGHAVNNPSVKVTFPTDDSKDSQLARFTAASITLQNLHGPGVGCPIVSTTFQAQTQAIQNGP